MLNEYELASARLLIRALKKHQRAKDVATLRQYLPEEIVAQIAARETELRQFNYSVKSNSACLSVGAAAWWAKAQAALRYGRLALALGGLKREKALSRLCERVEETFEAEVPDNEKGKFIIYDIKGGNWDDRWHWTVDGSFPLLNPTFSAAQTIPDVRLEAQIDVLSQIVEPPPSVQPPDNTALLRAMRREE